MRNTNCSFHFVSFETLQKRVGNTIDTVQGLQAVRYQFEEHALDNGIHNEANKCFCRNGKISPREMWSRNTKKNCKNMKFISEADLLSSAAINVLYWLMCV